METTAPWWEQAVIYQIYTRSFYDSDGDGIGDLPGIISKLDYISSLGVDAIWLNPIYPSPQYDFGYDIADYRGIDPQYGAMADFDRLLEEAHGRGIRIIMDIVPSVTSHLHPWFIESRSSRRSPKRDWYIWRDAPRPGRYPNNWRGVFGGRAWDWDKKTRQILPQFAAGAARPELAQPRSRKGGPGSDGILVCQGRRRFSGRCVELCLQG